MASRRAHTPEEFVPSLYRVFPFDPKAKVEEPGGPLYVPGQGGGRLDNPSSYSVLYLSDAAPGAIAEAFGRFAEWTAAMLAGSPALPGSVRALGRYSLPESEKVCDLDNAARLGELRLRPSQVVTRDYAQTRTWARKIYEEHRWVGVRWWSYYEPEWGSVGLWDVSKLSVQDVRPLRLDDKDLVAAAQMIIRRIVSR